MGRVPPVEESWTLYRWALFAI